MKINSISSGISFKAAYTHSEKETYRNDCDKALELLGKEPGDKITLILHDYAVPSSPGRNMGIGSLFSDAARNAVLFAKDMFRINSVLTSPEGVIDRPVKTSNHEAPASPSPYSGSNFAWGEHLIDLPKLTTAAYGRILPQGKIDEISHRYANYGVYGEFNVDYEAVIGNQHHAGTHETALDIAYKNFKQLPKEHFLRNQFDKFKTENADWLEKYVMYSALKKEHGDRDYKNWKNEVDAELYTGKIPEARVNQRKEEIRAKYADFIEQKAFYQFLADKQQKITKLVFNKKGIEIHGDMLIGNNDQEKWAYRPFLMDNASLGCTEYKFNEETGKEEKINNNWGGAMIDAQRLKKERDFGPMTDFIDNRFSLFFKRYDGVRVDAAWQYTHPSFFDKKGVNHETCNGTILFDKMEEAAQKVYGKNFNPKNIMLELLGGRWSESAALLNAAGKKYPLIEHTQYAKEGWGRAAYYNQDGVLEHGHLGDGNYTLGIGTHDDISLIALAKNCFVQYDTEEKTKEKRTGTKADRTEKGEEQIPHLIKDLALEGEDAINDEKAFRRAKFAELFTTKNQFFTYTDAFGIEEAINTPNYVGHENWSKRLPSYYESFYHGQVAQGFGLNLPEALKMALVAKGKSDDYKNKPLIERLERAAEILRNKKGPMTEAEANEKYGEGCNRITGEGEPIRKHIMA